MARVHGRQAGTGSLGPDRLGRAAEGADAEGRRPSPERAIATIPGIRPPFEPFKTLSWVKESLEFLKNTNRAHRRLLGLLSSLQAHMEVLRNGLRRLAGGLKH